MWVGVFNAGVNRDGKRNKNQKPPKGGVFNYVEIGAINGRTPSCCPGFTDFVVLVADEVPAR